MSQAPRRTILFLVTEDWYFVSHRLPLAAAAVEAGYRVVVATRVQRHAAAIEAAGCELVPLRLRRSGRNPVTEVLALVELVRLYRRVRPDIVHHIALKPVLYGSIAARLAGVPVVANAVAGMGYIFSSTDTLARFLRPAMRTILRALLGGSRSWVILQNPDDLQTLLAAKTVELRRVVMMPGAGVDLEVFRPSKLREGPPVVLLATRMIWDKGVGEFVSAARMLRAEGSAARFVLVGAPDPENPAAVSEAQLVAWQKEGAVEWWGQRSDMPAVLRQASIFCFPSAYGEGIPKVLLEAAAVGLPIVTTDAPGCREVVTAGDNGLLVPLRDAGAVAAAVRRLLNDPATAEQMGRRSREIAESRFGVDRVVMATIELYRRLAPLEPRLLLLVTEDWFVASHWMPLIRGARARGYHVTVATRIQAHGDVIRAAGAEVVPIRLARSGRNPIGELLAVVELISLYRTKRPDIVHHVALKPVLYGSVAALATRRTLVVNAIPGLGYAFAGASFGARLIRPFLLAGLRLVLGRKVSMALFENPDDRQLLIDMHIVASARTALVPGAGVNLSIFKFAEPPAGLPLVVLPGRMLWDKGVGEFIAAAQQLRGDGVKARFALVGNVDPANPAAIDVPTLKRWNAEGVVEWWGQRTDMPEVFRQATIVCLPSYREGLPKALSEAAACGRPVVTTNVPGCREVVENGTNGLLVPIKDPSQLAEALRQLLMDPAMCRRFGVAGRARAEAMFGESRAVAEIFAAYERMQIDA